MATSNRLHDSIDSDEELVKLAGGFGFLEGLAWSERAQALYFSDVTGRTRNRWRADTNEIEVIQDPSNISNGMAFAPNGDLFICEHATSSVVLETSTGSRTVASRFRGAELNSPNDVIVGADRSVYFTDPAYGRTAAAGIERRRELDFEGVFRIAPGGGLELVADDFAAPNGLCLSPDYRLLYVNDTPRAEIRMFEVRADGSTRGGARFAADIGTGAGEVDGMKCDELGNVFVSGPGGIWVFAPSGERLGVIAIPEPVGNFAWGGHDWRTLFIGATTTLFRLTTRSAGAHFQTLATPAP